METLQEPHHAGPGAHPPRTSDDTPLINEARRRPTRSPPPPRPTGLPYPATPENRARLEQHLLQTYASTSAPPHDGRTSALIEHRPKRRPQTMYLILSNSVKRYQLIRIVTLGKESKAQGRAAEKWLAMSCSQTQGRGLCYSSSEI